MVKTFMLNSFGCWTLLNWAQFEFDIQYIPFDKHHLFLYKFRWESTLHLPLINCRRKHWVTQTIDIIFPLDKAVNNCESYTIIIAYYWSPLRSTGMLENKFNCVEFHYSFPYYPRVTIEPHFIHISMFCEIST